MTSPVPCPDALNPSRSWRSGPPASYRAAQGALISLCDVDRRTYPMERHPGGRALDHRRRGRHHRHLHVRMATAELHHVAVVANVGAAALPRSDRARSPRARVSQQRLQQCARLACTLRSIGGLRPLTRDGAQAGDAETRARPARTTGERDGRAVADPTAGGDTIRLMACHLA